MEMKLKNCTVRRFRFGDETSLVRSANNRKLWRNLRDRFPHPYTMDDAVWWVQAATATYPTTDFAIEVDGAAVGGVGLILRDDVYRGTAEIGYWLGEEFWGRGIATEALIAVTEYAFANFDLCRLYAHVFDWNGASSRVLEKAGYEFEGRMRKSVIKEGQTIDQLMYAMVRD